MTHAATPRREAEVSSLTFQSQGVELVGDLYLPTASSWPVPAVVTAPGFAGVKEMLLPGYGTALAEAGVACLAFDHAGFGASGGNPRQHVDPTAQLAAFHAALDVLQRDQRFDKERLGVWGMSWAGGQALSVAASDARVRCAVSMIPFIASHERPPAWVVGKVIADAVGRCFGRPGAYVDVMGPPGARALMTKDGASTWLRRATAGAPSYINRVTVASLPKVGRYSAARAAAAVNVPLRVVVATADTINPPALALSALASPLRGKMMSPVDIVKLDQTHFGLFDTHLEETQRLLVEWFVKHFLP